MMKTKRLTKLSADFLNILRRTQDLIGADVAPTEVFSIERLEAVAAEIAQDLKVDPHPKPGKALIPKMKRTGEQLFAAYTSLVEANRGKQTVSPAAEWIIDNFHIIEEQLRGIQQDLPPNYYYELPKVISGPQKGYPRVYAMAIEFINRTDSLLEAESLEAFIQSFQRVSPLSIGELWALPITLRIALLEHLRPIALRVASSRLRRLQADKIADHLLELAATPEMDSADLIRKLSEALGAPEKFDRALVVHLIARLRDQDPDVWPAFDWLEKQLLATHHLTTSQLVQVDHQRQAVAQVTVGNIIASMRFLVALDWRKFFEKVSVVEPILNRDPLAVYAKMDFATRDRYRHSVERMSRYSDFTEIEVSEKAVDFARKSSQKNPADERRAHLGYYLISDGVTELETELGYRPRFRESLRRALQRGATGFYLGVIALFTLAGVLALPKEIWIFSLPASFLVSDLALSLLNHYITLFIHPRQLPRIDTEKGIPGDALTMVVVPTLFSNEKTVERLVDALEIRYLGNDDPSLFFALLGDFSDAASETIDGDTALLNYAAEKITELNRRYPTRGSNRFHLFHRKRKWNDSEGKWLGWERKRGKLLEFNRLLRGATDTTFITSTADSSLLSRVKYVITLDSDTQLPRESARQLVGIILHPLNRPRYDKTKERVVEGYGILQPRIGVDLTSALRTRFSKLFSGNTGLDPYTTAVSDVYQDLFAEGSFTGKGLYVVDAFEEALAGRVPENSVLSHDLFEGSYARAGLVTDVELLDDYPADYDTALKRNHRWIRGDWQISRWLFPRVPDARGRSVSNPLSLISRWKIFDNLRRSLMPIMMLAWLVLAWTVLPGSPGTWTLPVLIVVVFPVYAPIIAGGALNRRGLPWREHIRSGWFRTQIKLGQIFMTLAFLVDQAWNTADAIVRTLYRMLVSKKQLLEWVSFAQSQDQTKENSFSYLKSIGPSGAITLGITVLVAGLRPEALPIASPFLVTWFLTPFIKLWINRKPSSRRPTLQVSEKQELRNFARRTWHFFETFVTEKDHWLAPDNFQNDPKPILAERTSPTNIGLQVLSTVSAYDFGYLGVGDLVDRLEKTMFTLDRLEKLHGHCFNWYDTSTLAPLNPRYISTVDSGNLAGHLITLKQACLEISRNAAFNPSARAGLLDTFEQLRQEAQAVSDLAYNAGTATLEHLQIAITECHQYALLGNPKSPVRWADYFTVLLSRLLECEDILNAVAAEESAEKFAELRIWLSTTIRLVSDYQSELSIFTKNEWPSFQRRLLKLAEDAERIALAMDFSFLLDETRKVFSIGLNVADNRRDVSYYDLLASEARLTSFFAIAKGDAPLEHWFRLGRQMTDAGSSRALVSWTATMFEYLMPLLVMRRYEDTLLDQTYDATVARQIEYGKQQEVPWGISEAGYNARDLNLNFQYGPFGVPGLGLKRGLSDELVISPYSTMLAAMVDPPAALVNLRRLAKIGAFSTYGFFESIDYTPERLPKDQSHFILRSYMAHHQGMSLISLNNLLNHSIMQNRFHSDPRVQATELLLQERIPEEVPLAQPRVEEVRADSTLRFTASPKPRLYSDVHSDSPRTQLLSNGNYSVMVSSAGSGYSRCGKLSINRWREDVTRDHWGQFIYLRDRASGKTWSSAFQPIGITPEFHSVTFGEEKIEFLRQDGEFRTHTEIIVSPEDDVELRRVTVMNLSSEVAEIEVTSFMETVLAKPADDIAHPAFSNLFVQTEYVPQHHALLATRRRRSNQEAQVWGFHLLTSEAQVIGVTQYETDRGRFIGRGRTPASPRVVTEGRPLSGTVGSVLDPIFSIRETVRIFPGESARLTFTTGLTNSREQALQLSEKYHDLHVFLREAKLAWTQSKVQLRHLNISQTKAHNFQRLASRILFSNPNLRPRSHLLAANTKSQSSLWAYGISGDLPIILTRISDEKDMPMIRELLHAHEYLRLRGLDIDLVILNERAPSYQQSLQEEIQRQIRMSASQALLDKPGGIFMRRADIIPAEDLILLKTVARVVISAENGTIEEQMERVFPKVDLPKEFVPAVVRKSESVRTPNFVAPTLQFFNSVGGFTERFREYVIILKENQWTPLPWINVVANSKDFGFIVTEAGSGYTWSVNSRENRLTSWSNDPISDPVSEALYIRDEMTGEYWSPTPLPIREPEPYLVRHGHGYTQFEHTSHGIAQELRMFVPLDATVKISRLRLKNLGAEKRKLSLTTYTEWVLGFNRNSSAPLIVTEKDEVTGTLYARNPYNNEFAQRIAFTDISEVNRSFTSDRKEFIGRNGRLDRPEAMKRSRLSGAIGAGLDPCAALQTLFELAPGEERELIIVLGQAENIEKARELAMHYRESSNIEEALQAVHAYWDETLSTIEIRTPDAGMNALANRWLVYQTLACRMWARSAFYQSGGAFGFRDQLQDSMALVYSRPEITRAQILLAAARQFKEGDVQHWWHPPTGRGVRTHFSDDLLWLPSVTSFYVEKTGDTGILDQIVPFIEAPLLAEGQDDAYTQPWPSGESASLLEHCARAIDRSLRTGVHGLPLMGSGDWNDGMNRVGHEGKGESVWVAWFLYKTMNDFIPLAEKAGEMSRVARYRDHLIKLKSAVETAGWDGEWYRRAYYDDGTPLGSAMNSECMIDSITQSWSVLSGAGDPKRSASAMRAVNEHLVHYGDGLIKLFTPPFDHAEHDPGYIKGYVPGVRENGGQYTHAAIWTVMAYAALGDGERAGELYSMLNPIHHATTRANLQRYKVEPYVIAADIYALPPHVGRGGWTWYTGSASWMYRAALESILGFQLTGDTLRIKPCIPSSWPGFSMTYRRGKTDYQIEVVNGDDYDRYLMMFDGKEMESNVIPLVDDEKPHSIRIRTAGREYRRE